MLLGLAAGLVAFGVAIYAMGLGLLATLAVGVGVALLVWWGLGLVWGVGEPVFVTPAPRVRRIVVDPAAAEAAAAKEAAAAAEAAIAAALAPPPVAAPVPAAPAKAAVVRRAPVVVANLTDADLFSYPPVIRPRRTTRILPKEEPATEVGSAVVEPGTAQPVVAVPAAGKPKAAAKPKGPARPKAAAKSAATKAGAAKASAKPRAAKAIPIGPTRLKAPRKGRADDLKVIAGIGPSLEKLVNGLGFYHFDQIAGWSDADVALVDAEMKTFKGRVSRDKWVVQARILAAGGTVEEAEAAARI